MIRDAGALPLLDHAFARARASFSEVCVPAWAGGALLAAVLLGIYYLERIEGIRTLRLPLAAALVLAWWGRALLLGRAARSVARQLSDAPFDAGGPIATLRTSIVIGFGMWIWSWLLTLGSLGGPIGVLLVLPLLALRGVFAPSWIARAACTRSTGWRALAAALGDHQGQRFTGLLLEAMLLLGALGLAVNLYASALILLMLGRSFVGLELASIETFLSPENTFVLLAVLALALVVIEPLRAALSALLYLDARARADGLDLRASIERAIAHASRRAGTAARAALVLLACASPSIALAQEPAPAFPAPPLAGSSESTPLPKPEPPPQPPPIDPGPMPAASLTDDDRAVADDVEAILARAEFREFADHRGDGLRDLIERLFEWLFRNRPEAPRFEVPNIGGITLPGAWFFIALALSALAGVGLYLWLTRKKERSEVRALEDEVVTDPRARPPAAFLDEAAQLADDGDLRAALRSLYLATLVALDRRRLIAFDPHRTNWQYLRQMPRGSARDAFAQFTRLFDHKWYGLEPTARPDYERCRVLAREIVDDGRDEALA